MDKIFVLGIGQLGQEVAKYLIYYGKSIILIDKNEEKLKNFQKLNASIAVLNSENIDALRELEIRENDRVFVSMGENIGSSIITTQNLIDLGIKNIFVRVIDKRHEKIIKSLGIKNTIRPYKVAAKQLIYKLINDIDALPFGDSKHLIVNLINNKIKKLQIKDIKINIKNFQIILVRPNNKDDSFIPNGETKIDIGDKVTILTSIDQVKDVNKLFLK